MPGPLQQPVLSRSQWVRIIFIGALMAIGTLALETIYEPTGAAVAATMGFVVFSLLNVVIGLASRSETRSTFNSDILSDRRQLMLYGLALLLTLLPTETGLGQRILGVTPLTFDQWLLCIGVALALLLVDEVIKVFLRRRHTPASGQKPPAVPAAPNAAATV